MCLGTWPFLVIQRIIFIVRDLQVLDLVEIYIITWTVTWTSGTKDSDTKKFFATINHTSPLFAFKRAMMKAFNNCGVVKA